MELALTGDPIDAERAHALGVVNRLAEPGGAVDAALELAARIAPNGPLALDATKQIVYAQRDWSDADFWDEQAKISDPVFASQDAREGATAFSEKREPVWQGR
jgi:enoyl-CoA hydratase